MARHGPKSGSQLIQKIGLNSLNSKQPIDKLRKNSLEQSLEETEQQASAAVIEEHNNQMLPSTNHQLNRISTNGNDGNNRNSFNSNLEVTSNLALISRLMMISGVSLIFLTLFISVFCYFRLKAKQQLLMANNENSNALTHGSSEIAIDNKQSLNASQCALSSISATLLQQQSNLENGTINSLFANNLSNCFNNNLNNLNADHSFIIAGTGALFTPNDSTTANLTIYSPSTINYADSNKM